MEDPRRLVDSRLGGGRPLREVPPVELFLPPAGPHVVEVAGDDGPPHGFAVAGAAVYDLADPIGLDEFLRGPGTALDPLPLVLLVTRYRLPALVDASPVRLVTSAAELHPSVAAAGVPVDFSREDGAIAFTTQFSAAAPDGSVRVGVDRWRLAAGDDALLEGRTLKRAEAAA